MDEAQLAAACDANYWRSFAPLARACGGAVLEREDIIGVCTGLPVAMLNQGFVTRPPRDVDRSLRELLAFFDDAGVPFIIRIREGVAPTAEEALETMGLPYTDTVPGMALFPIAEAPPPQVCFTIEVVQDERALSDFQRVAAEGFGMPLDLSRRLFVPEVLAVPEFESYLGYVEGQPVATSTLYSLDGTAGIYNVSTLPTHRRRGLGAAITSRAVMRGKEQGCSVSILQASAMGQPVYEAMGFRTVAPYRTFARRQHASEA